MILLDNGLILNYFFHIEVLCGGRYNYIQCGEGKTMKGTKKLHHLVVASAFIILLSGGCLSGNKIVSQEAVKSFKDYPDHAFNATEYVQGMKWWINRFSHLLIWQDPTVDLTKYTAVKVTDFDGRLLPEQTAFSYDEFIAVFNSTFQGSRTPTKEGSPNTLLIEGAVVECNPGSRAARYFVGSRIGFGKIGKAAGGVVCEVYEPDKTQPCIRIYTRETEDRFGSFGFGGDSVAMLHQIFTELGNRLGAALATTLPPTILSSSSSSAPSSSSPSPSSPSPQPQQPIEQASDDSGIISITSDPPGAKIFIDGEYKGQTPAEISLAAGTYQVFLQRQLYEPYKDSLAIEKGQTKTLNIRLLPEGKEQK
jgi:hypothetical protein